jgi:ribonucleoside-diphosphate reductase alpha chain
MCAFGCFTESGPIMDIMGHGLNAITNHPDMISDVNGRKLFPDNLPAPYLVPINASLEVKLEWLAGFFDVRSFITKFGISIVSVNDKLLQDTQLLLTTLGTYSLLEHEENVKVPLSEEKTISICNYSLIIPWQEFEILLKLGLKGIYSELEIPKESEGSNNISLLIKHVVDVGRISSAFCFSEPKNNAGVFNGILTGQCSEII